MLGMKRLFGRLFLKALLSCYKLQEIILIEFEDGRTKELVTKSLL